MREPHRLTQVGHETADLRPRAVTHAQDAGLLDELDAGVPESPPTPRGVLEDRRQVLALDTVDTRREERIHVLRASRRVDRANEAEEVANLAMTEQAGRSRGADRHATDQKALEHRRGVRVRSHED